MERAHDNETANELCRNGKCGQEVRDPASAFPGRDGEARAVVAIAEGNRAVLPERSLRPPADRSGADGMGPMAIGLAVPFSNR